MSAGLSRPEQGGPAATEILSSVAVLAPRGRDALVAAQLLTKDGIKSSIAPTLEALAELVVKKIGAVLITEEALSGAGLETLAEALAAQPPWSDIPFVVLANGAIRSRSDRASDKLDFLNNLVLLSRPLHAEELVRSVRSALNARSRQHEARKQLEELQLRERQLYESEAKFHAIANSIDQMIWSTLPNGFHDYYNDRWYEYTGVPEGSTDGEAWNDMFHPDDQDRAREKWCDCLKAGGFYEIEYRLRHRSGNYRWVLGRAQPVRGRDGTILRWYGTCTDIHDIKMAEEQRQLMMAEMNHRVKNTLAMVNVMVSQTLRRADNLQDAQASIQSRITMMAQAHDRLIGSVWTKTHIREVIDAVLEPHQSGDGRFLISGPNISIGSKQALGLTMALHELATNAGKYGALSLDGGKVSIGWRVEQLKNEKMFAFDWIESEGPPVDKPTRRGFGSRMIEQALAAYFSGTAELYYGREGLVFRLEAPLSGMSK